MKSMVGLGCVQERLCTQFTSHTQIHVPICGVFSSLNQSKCICNGVTNKCTPSLWAISLNTTPYVCRCGLWMLDMVVFEHTPSHRVLIFFSEVHPYYSSYQFNHSFLSKFLNVLVYV